MAFLLPLVKALAHEPKKKRHGLYTTTGAAFSVFLPGFGDELRAARYELLREAFGLRRFSERHA
jgi:hypothetical protein